MKRISPLDDNHSQLAHLRKVQDRIRDVQRDRIDEIHSVSHEYERNILRRKYGQVVDQKEQDEMLQRIHTLTHEFMRGMDEAVIIHETMALIQGHDPKSVTSALWPVRTHSESGLRNMTEDEAEEAGYRAMMNILKNYRRQK